MFAANAHTVAALEDDAAIAGLFLYLARGSAIERTFSSLDGVTTIDSQDYPDEMTDGFAELVAIQPPRSVAINRDGDTDGYVEVRDPDRLVFDEFAGAVATDTVMRLILVYFSDGAWSQPFYLMAGHIASISVVPAERLARINYVGRIPVAKIQPVFLSAAAQRRRSFSDGSLDYIDQPDPPNWLG